MVRPSLRRRRRDRGADTPAPTAAPAPASTRASATAPTPAPTPPSTRAPAQGTADERTATLVEERAHQEALDDPRSVPTPPSATGVRTRRVLDSTPVLLARAAHPRQAVLTAVLMGVAAALADRPTDELGLVVLTVLVGQCVLGWHNDLVDRRRDTAHDRPGKPVADGRLDPGTVWFALACAVLLVVPLSVSHGTTAGLFYLGSLLVGLLANVVLRTGVLSFVPWAAAYALYPAFLSYAGTTAQPEGVAPQPAMVVLAALLGIGVHLLTALWGLVADHEDGWTYLPLRLGLKLGAARLLALTSTYLGLVVAGLAVTGTLVGLRA